jgi:prepilin-type N-terminal cleavage/methylation domain-containing protein/prepilin-type processing-associated H-X9-DG protein
MNSDSPITLPARRTDSPRGLLACARRAFTLVELLVVIAIIAVLITILLPGLRGARDSAIRVKCMANIKQLTALSILYATNNKGQLPQLHNRPADPNDAFINPTPYWYSQTKRDQFLRLGMTRPMAYCPANPDWNRDDLWAFPPSNPFTLNSSIWGYQYLGGNPDMARNAAWGSWSHADPDPTVRLYFAVRVSDKPRDKAIWADLTRVSSAVGTPGFFRSSSGSNHLYGQEAAVGKVPAATSGTNGTGGTNVGFMDGHVEWRQQKEMKFRATDLLAGTRIYW